MTIQLHHGSPESIEEYLFEDDDKLAEYATNSTSDIICFGHTHLPFIKTIDEIMVVNSGSIGKPKIGKPVATSTPLFT